MKLNQIIAIVSGKKSKAMKLITEVHHRLGQKVSGITRTYQPKDEDGIVFPAESTLVQAKVSTVLNDVAKEYGDFFDLVIAQETANTQAVADLVIDDEALISNVPVTVLLFLDRQLTDLRTFVKGLPVLSPDKEWNFETNTGLYAAPDEQTVKTQKVPEVIIKYDATPEHPAQTEVYSLDKVIGTWTTKHLSGALSPADRDKMLVKIDKLIAATKVAREEANSCDVSVSDEASKAILSYIF